MNNPFYHGNPVSTTLFLGRKKELRRTTQRIYSQQSSAIIGEPRSGKTSVLLYLAAKENQIQFYGEDTEKCFHSYLDCLSFSDQIDQAQFWKQALSPVIISLIEPQLISKLATLYQKTEQQGFNSHSLGHLFDELNLEKFQLVLTLDEFDALLNHPKLNCSEFFGSLRSLASLKPALSLVIAARQPITKLNKATQELNNTGSPYFNYFEELTLGALSDKDVGKLLGRAGERFSNDDIKFIIYAAGAHPYLLQAIAYELWFLYEDDEIENPIQRRKEAAQKLDDIAARMLSETWSSWTPQARMAITVIVLTESPKLLKNHEFKLDGLLTNLRDFRPELRTLEKQGYIKQSNSNTSGWKIYPKAFEWWLADELIRTVRNEQAFTQWIQIQEWDGLLTVGEKQQLASVAKQLAQPLTKSITELIKVAIK